MPSAYKLVIGTALILTLSLIWIGTYEIVGAAGGIIESMNNMSSDASVNSYNNTAGQIMYYSILIIVIIIIIWIIKEDRSVAFNE